MQNRDWYLLLSAASEHLLHSCLFIAAFSGNIFFLVVFSPRARKSECLDSSCYKCCACDKVPANYWRSIPVGTITAKMVSTAITYKSRCAHERNALNEWKVNIFACYNIVTRDFQCEIHIHINVLLYTSKYGGHHHAASMRRLICTRTSWKEELRRWLLYMPLLLAKTGLNDSRNSNCKSRSLFKSSIERFNLDEA